MVDGVSRLFFEGRHQAASSDIGIFNDVFAGQGLVDVCLNEFDGLTDFIGMAFRMPSFGDSCREVQKGCISELVDLADGDAFFAFLGIKVNQPIGFLDIESSFDGTVFSDHADKTDKEILGLPEPAFGKLSPGLVLYGLRISLCGNRCGPW